MVSPIGADRVQYFVTGYIIILSRGQGAHQQLRLHNHHHHHQILLDSRWPGSLEHRRRSISSEGLDWKY